jgi:hypothetical protein
LQFIEERVAEIERLCARIAQDVLVLRLTTETLKLVVRLREGATLRVAERWQAETLLRYSYYWLDAQDELVIGWDNSPHHTQLDNFPHHKHIREQSMRVPSYEVCLEDVLGVLGEAMDDGTFGVCRTTF